LAVDEVIAIIA